MLKFGKLTCQSPNPSNQPKSFKTNQSTKNPNKKKNQKTQHLFHTPWFLALQKIWQVRNLDSQDAFFLSRAEVLFLVLDPLPRRIPVQNCSTQCQGEPGLPEELTQEPWVKKLLYARWFFSFHKRICNILVRNPKIR